MTPLLKRLLGAVRETLERTTIQTNALIATEALYHLAARCWLEIGSGRAASEDIPLDMIEAHEVLTTDWQGDIHRAIIRTANESTWEDAAFLYFMSGFLAAGYRDQIKYGRVPQWVQHTLNDADEMSADDDEE
jgi:hypothetical protein